MCCGLADLFTSWFIFIVVICHWPNGLVSEAHIINHEGHYCSIITLSLSEPAKFPVCALSISVHNTNTHTVIDKVCSTKQNRREQKFLVYTTKILHISVHSRSNKRCNILIYNANINILFNHICEEVILT